MTNCLPVCRILINISPPILHSKSLNADALKVMNRDHSSVVGKRLVNVHVFLYTGDSVCIVITVLLVLLVTSSAHNMC